MLTHLLHLGASKAVVFGSPTRLSAAALFPTRAPVAQVHPTPVVAPVIGAPSLRKRIGLPREAPLLASAQGEYRGLHLPGAKIVRHRWHPRLDVVLTSSQLLIAGNGQLARFDMSEIIAVSPGSSPPGSIRVDLLDGGQIRVSLRDGGTFFDALRHEIWAFDTELLEDASDSEWGFRADLDLVSRADALIQDIDARPLDPQADAERNREAFDLIRKSAELREDAHLEALRTRRKRLLDRC